MPAADGVRPDAPGDERRHLVRDDEAQPLVERDALLAALEPPLGGPCREHAAQQLASDPAPAGARAHDGGVDQDHLRCERDQLQAPDDVSARAGGPDLALGVRSRPARLAMQGQNRGVLGRGGERDLDALRHAPTVFDRPPQRRMSGRCGYPPVARTVARL